MNTDQILEVIKILKKEALTWKAPVVSFQVASSGSPFRILLATIMSLRTKDQTTEKVAKKFFKVADTVEKVQKLSLEECQNLLYPVGFYKTKAQNILKMCDILAQKYNSIIPDNIDELLTLPGVGRKTANLVVSVAYGKPGLCVDVHVHRISNRLGYIKTKNPLETEMVLREKLPVEEWKNYNTLLVGLGQTICTPISPKCSICPLSHLCEKVGIEKHR